MIFHYKGKYSGDENTLPVREHPKGYVPFKEPENMKKMAVILNIAATLVMIVFAYFAVLRGKNEFTDFDDFFKRGYLWMFAGIIISMLAMFPHEILHASCFKSDVEMYTNLKQGMMFVVGTEDMSKSRFVFMSMLPNIVFGFIPFIIYMIFPKFVLLGALGVISIGSGAGDYMNVINCLVQVPKGGKVYMSGMHSYWYK